MDETSVSNGSNGALNPNGFTMQMSVLAPILISNGLIPHLNGFGNSLGILDDRSPTFLAF
jgi:hypothetical protein